MVGLQLEYVHAVVNWWVVIADDLIDHGIHGDLPIDEEIGHIPNT